MSEDAPTVQHARFEEEDETGQGSFQLVVTEGPDLGATTRVDGSTPGALLIGTSEACALRLTDPTVSRRHAQVDIATDGRLRLCDGGSTNGTWLGSVGVGEVLMKGGETFALGGTHIRVERIGQQTPTLPQEGSFGRLLGSSKEMRRRYPLFERLASTDIPVLIEGETGTGKEVLAEALHEMGPRAAAPFVVFDCTAVPASLMESELFGVQRGAFTGASAIRPGLLEQAAGGTLLIDEIGDLELALQPKLLRVIERREVRRVGGTAVLPIDARILAATRRNLDIEVQEGRFRDDLFHRLAVGRVEMPALRHRQGDVLTLARHFWQSLGGDPAGLTNRLLRQWESYSWPGNVRELRNAVTRHFALGDMAMPHPSTGEALSVPSSRPAADVVEALLAERLPLPIARRRLREAFELRYVEIMLADHGGNVSKAAAASGIARRYFQQVRARAAKPQSGLT